MVNSLNTTGMPHERSHSHILNISFLTFKGMEVITSLNRAFSSSLQEYCDLLTAIVDSADSIQMCNMIKSALFDRELLEFVRLIPPVKSTVPSLLDTFTLLLCIGSRSHTPCWK